MNKVIGIDIGTTSVRSALYNADTGEFSIVKQKTVEQYYPQIGWVEEDADEIYLSTILCLNDALDSALLDVKGIGITNMRETVVAWDSETGKALCNAIVWQCRRTSKYCQKLKNSKMGKIIHSKTGLVPDAYFSATKIKWLLENNLQV